MNNNTFVATEVATIKRQLESYIAEEPAILSNISKDYPVCLCTHENSHIMVDGTKIQLYCGDRKVLQISIPDYELTICSDRIFITSNFIHYELVHI